MKHARNCSFCGTEVNLGDRLPFEVASEDWEEVVHQLTPILGPPTYVGTPGLICDLCRASIQENDTEILAELKEDTKAVRLFLQTLFWAFLLSVVALAVTWIVCKSGLI